MRKKLFIFNAILLTGTSLINRVIGIAFRVYMSNKIGAEGIGLLGLIGSVYFFGANFATTGISITVTRLVTDSIAKKEYKKSNIYTILCLFISIIISVIVGIFMFIYSDFIGTVVLRDQRTILSLKILAPALPFMAVSSCFRGYFYAVRKVIKTASEQLLEQIIEILVFSAIIGVLAPRGLEYACCAIVIGTTLAEVISCGYSLILYILDRKGNSNEMVSYKTSLKKIAEISIPITVSNCLRSGLSTLENVLIPEGFKKMGQSSHKSLSIYGLVMGMVMPIITFPAVVLYSFSMLLIPEMSEANAINHKKNISYIASKILKITSIFSIMVSAVFMFFAKDFGLAIYKSLESGAYISILAPIVPIMYLDSVVDGMLKGLNQQARYLMYNIIDSILRVIAIYIFLPIYGIKALLSIMFFSTILNFSLSILRLIKVAKLKIDIKNWVIKPIIAAVFSCGVMYIIVNATLASSLAYPLKLTLEVVVACFIYLALIAMFDAKYIFKKIFNIKKKRELI